MQWARILADIDFNDSGIQEIHIVESKVTVVIRLWTENEIELAFLDYLRLLDRGAVVANLCGIDCTQNSDFLERTLAQADIQDKRLYSHYRFISGWEGVPVLEIVSTGVRVRERPSR